MRTGRKGKASLMSKHRTRTRRWSRLLSGVLCLALVLGLLPAAGMVRTARAAETPEPADTVHWATPYAERLVEWGVMTPAADLRLNAEATRAEFVAMCNRAFGYTKLGSMPFTDVPSTKWYAEDINIAYNAGYFQGKSATIAAPNDPLTREQAAVLLARILRLQETVGESLGFTDSRDLHEWSRGLIAAAVNDGIISGYADGSYRPFRNVTRGELAVMLVRAIGNPVSTVDKPEVYGNVTISTSNVTLRDTIILGNLYITGGVDLGSALLENVTVIGRIVISGGGVSDAARSSVILRNVVATEELVIDSMVDQFVTVSAYGCTDIPLTRVRSDAYLEDVCEEGYGLQRIELAGKPGIELQLSGKIKEVVNITPSSLLRLVKGTAKRIVIDERATSSELQIDEGTVVEELKLDVATVVTGKGDIGDLDIGAADCEVDIIPGRITVRPGLTATVDGEEVGSTKAAEMSSQPRLMAGYPNVSDLLPTQAKGLFSGNKPGTIYWAVSETARGSVSAADLIKNPAYGGNIFKDGEKPQSGSISADSRIVYAQDITGLLPDGSYYISAVLVDDRGEVSPVKVFSFTTPDNTQPAFVDGYPYMSRVSCQTAQVTAMTNKSCLLYWVLLPVNAAAPTEQNFITNSFGGSYGSGSMSVTKNVPVSVKVNDYDLPENTEFELYLWLTDGTLSSEVVHVTNEEGKYPTFRTPDETPPVVTSITQINHSQALNDVDFAFTINEDDAALYWAVVTESNETFIKPTDDMNSLAIQLKVEFGTGAIAYGNMKAAGAEVTTAAKAAGLRYSEYGTHNFKLYYMAKDGSGNYSEVKYITVHTVDNDPPTVTLNFSDAMYNTDADKAAGRKPRPQSNSDLVLVFSEQVKGDSGEDVDTFVELYNNVAAYKDSGDITMLNYYKGVLAEELKKHITLIHVQGRQETELKPRDEADYDVNLIGWVDFREAIVELEKEGTVTLTLPGDTAVHLGSGMTYYFHFKDIYDDAYTANLLVLRDDNGNIIAGDGKYENELDMDRFTTVYAQVWLDADDSGISDTSGTPSLVDKDGKPIPLDMVVNVTPQSTANTTATDCWDMVFWSDIAVKFDVYRRVSTGTNSWTAWELAAEGVSIDGLGQNNNTALTAASLNRYKTTRVLDEDGYTPNGYIGGKDFEGNTNGGKEYTRARYDTVVGGLQEGPVYQYGISFTNVNDSNDRKAWTSLVQMRFSLVAGMQGNVMNLSVSGSVNSNYTDLVYTKKLLDEIGSVVQGNTTGSILQIERQFSDTRLPEFTNTSPTFDARTGTIDISFALNREGTVYFVVAPADGTVPTTFDGIEINYEKDGRKLDNNTYADLGAKGNAIKAGIASKDIDQYIPLSGAERDAFGPTKDDDGKVTVEGIVDFSKVTAPMVRQIFSGAFKGNLVRTGSIKYEGTREPIRIAENLAPGTWYYVYLVLQSSSGNLDTEVHIYRVQTQDVEPPVITISHYDEAVKDTGSNTETTHVGVSMTITESTSDTKYDSPVLNYALLRKDNLPALLTGPFEARANDFELPSGYDSYDKDDGQDDSSKKIMTVLDAMLTRSGRQTYFDLYATDDLKTDVMQYITQATGADKWGVWIKYYDQVGADKLTETNPWKQDCTDQLTTAGEYILLACARNHYKDGAKGENFGFAAVQGLYKPDDVPPKLNVPAVNEDGTGSITANITGNWGATGSTWTRGMPKEMGTEAVPALRWDYSGSIAIAFDKPIYVYDGGVLKQVVAKNIDDVDDGEISILKVIGGTVSFTDVEGNGDNTVFTLTFNRIRTGQYFTLSRPFNSSGSDTGRSPNTLVVTFGTRLDDGGFYETADGKVTDFRQVEAYFNVTWK